MSTKRWLGIAVVAAILGTVPLGLVAQDSSEPSPPAGSLLDTLDQLRRATLEPKLPEGAFYLRSFGELEGIPEFAVVVFVSDQANTVTGLSVEDVQTTAELVLRRNGIKIQELCVVPDGEPPGTDAQIAAFSQVMLMVQASAMESGACMVMVSLCEVGVFSRGPDKRFGMKAIVWQDFRYGTFHSPYGRAALKAEIEALVEKFANEYLRANPHDKGSEPGPPSMLERMKRRYLKKDANTNGESVSLAVNTSGIDGPRVPSP